MESRIASSRSEVMALFRRYGITPTQQRIEIGQILFARTQHLSAELLMEKVNGAGHAVSKATVYNTLGLFADKGLIREVVIDPTKRFYDTNLEPHHHIYHTDTGKLEDVHAGDVRIGQLPQLPAGTEIEGVDLVIRVRATSR